MERIEPGKYVELGYDLYAVEADGKEQLVHQTDKSDPEDYLRSNARYDCPTRKSYRRP